MGVRSFLFRNNEILAIFINKIKAYSLEFNEVVHPLSLLFLKVESLSCSFRARNSEYSFFLETLKCSGAWKIAFPFGLEFSRGCVLGKINSGNWFGNSRWTPMKFTRQLLIERGLGVISAKEILCEVWEQASCRSLTYCSRAIRLSALNLRAIQYWSIEHLFVKFHAKFISNRCLEQGFDFFA